jgi:hypothetical protein
MGFLRLLTNKHVMQEEVVSPDQAWEPIERYDRTGEFGTWRADRACRVVALLHVGKGDIPQPLD